MSADLGLLVPKVLSQPWAIHGKIHKRYGHAIRLALDSCIPTTALQDIVLSYTELLPVVRVNIHDHWKVHRAERLFAASHGFELPWDSMGGYGSQDSDMLRAACSAPLDVICDWMIAWNEGVVLLEGDDDVAVGRVVQNDILFWIIQHGKVKQ